MGALKLFTFASYSSILWMKIYQILQASVKITTKKQGRISQIIIWCYLITCCIYYWAEINRRLKIKIFNYRII